MADAGNSLVVDGGEPVLNQRTAIGVIRMVDPEILTKVFAVRYKTLTVVDHTADAAAGTRHNQSNILASHLPSIVKQVGLHVGQAILTFQPIRIP